MVKKLLSILVSSFILILILFMSFWLSISEEKLLSWSRHHLNRISPKEIKAEIQGVKTRFWGLEVDRIELTNPVRGEALLTLTEIEVHFNLITVVFKQELPFEFTAYSGKGNGALGFLPKPKIRLSASNLELNWIPPVRRSQIIKSNPKLSFSGNYTPSDRTGNLRLNIQNLKISGSKAHTNLTVDLPDTELVVVGADITLKNNQLHLDADTSGDITAKLTGKIMGSLGRIQRSKVDMKLRADIRKRYQNELGILNNMLDSYRSKSGRISVHLTGNLMLPKIRKI